MLFTWNPSPLRSSKFSFEYLLLPPRSAPEAVSLKFALELHNNLRALLLTEADNHATVVESRSLASALSVFGAS